MEDLYLAYLKERYNEYDFYPLTLEQIAKRFEELQEAVGHEIIKRPEGFITYKLEGDAVMFEDFYLQPAYRGHSPTGWKFHDEVIQIGKKCGKRVAIGFADVLGKNHIKGIRAMEMAGFKRAYKTHTEEVFIKGI